MKKFYYTCYFLIISALIFTTGCRISQTGITLAGSTSVQPFAEMLAEEYMKLHPGTNINIQGGGSTAGIEAVKARAANIGMSSRELTINEKQVVEEITIARDAIAVIVNPKNPVRDLTLKQLQDLFSGKTTNWKKVGGIDNSVIIVTREEGSGTRGAFEDLVMEGALISAKALVMDSTGAVREIVAQTPYAIGYISLGLVDERVIPIKVGGIPATRENLLEGKYLLARPFLLVINRPLSPLAEDFIKFALSTPAQKMLTDEGLIAEQ